MSESRDPAGDSTTTNNMGEVREAEHQGAAVKAALGANIGVAIAKLCAAFFTGSSAMLSESVHSIADCSNEIVLMIGGRFSKHKTDGDHPFGLYRAKYLASFVVATLLFFVGGFFSTSEAVKKLVAISADPALRDVNRMELLVAFIVVVISACLEGYGLHQSIKEANERMERTNTPRMGVFRFWRHTKSAELASVIMEDTLALIGLAFAGLGIGLAILLDDEIFDALGGLMVGLVLIVGSLFLAFKSGSLLIGEAVDSDTRGKIVEAVTTTPGVERLLNMQTVHMSEDDILLCVKVQTSKLDRDYDVETVDKIEKAVRTALPGTISRSTSSRTSTAPNTCTRNRFPRNRNRSIWESPDESDRPGFPICVSEMVEVGLFLGHQIQVGVVPQVLVAVGHEQHAFRIQRLDRALVVGDQHNRALVFGDGLQNLVAGRRIQIVGRFIKQ